MQLLIHAAQHGGSAADCLSCTVALQFVAELIKRSPK